jgi:hypothetical protein
MTYKDFMLEPDGRRPGRDFKKQKPKTYMSPNGRLPTTLREPIRANPRHQARICGASAMWVRRATQRAEPRAQTGFQGRRAGRLLAAGFPQLFINIARAKDGEGDYLSFLPYGQTYKHIPHTEYCCVSFILSKYLSHTL